MYPKEAGLFLALKKDRAILVRITGFYPYLHLRDGYDLGHYLVTGELKPIEQGIWYGIQQDLDKEWLFSPVLTETDNPKLTKFVNAGEVELTQEEKEWAADAYKECTRAGCSSTSILQMAKSKFNLSTAQAKALLDEISKNHFNR